MSIVNTGGGQALQIGLSGPALPPRFTASITSDPSGVGLGDAGAFPGGCTRDSDTSVTCTTGAGQGDHLARSFGVPNPTYSAQIPLSISLQQPPTRLTLHLSVPDGYDVPDNDLPFGYAPGPRDVKLTGLHPVTDTADASGDQQFSASLDADGVPGLTYRLTDGPAGATLHVDATSGGAATFTVHAPGATDSHGVTIAVGLPDGFVDSNDANNTATSTFSPHHDQAAPIELGNPDPAAPGPDGRTGDEQHSYTFTLHATGLDKLASVDFRLDGDGADLIGPAPGSCNLSAGKVECRNPADGDYTFHVRYNGNDALPITVTADGSNSQVSNAASVTLTPFSAYDVAVTGISPDTIARPGPNDEYTLTAHVTVPDGLQTVTYAFGDKVALVSAKDSAGTACALDANTAACSNPKTGEYTFVIRPTDGQQDTTVKLTASIPPPLRGDTDDSNNSSVPVTLHPYDVLTNLAPTTGTADTNGNQTFTADLDIAGLAGATFALDNPPSDTLSYTVAADRKSVSFEVHSTLSTSHQVSIRAVLPDGYSDAKDLIASATWTPAPVDISMDSLTPIQVNQQYTTVATTVSGIPDTVTTLDFWLTGLGTGHNHARFDGGDGGATGDGQATCAVLSDDHVQCTNIVGPDVKGRFSGTFHVFNPPGQASEDVSISVDAGIAEADLTNNARQVTIGD
ncbi:MAG: hypothetical protein ACXVXM_00380 [Nocardioidaceae bacterium]